MAADTAKGRNGMRGKAPAAHFQHRNGVPSADLGENVDRRGADIGVLLGRQQPAQQLGGVGGGHVAHQFSRQNADIRFPVTEQGRNERLDRVGQ